MANIKSQIKRNRQNEKRRQRNRVVRSELRTRVKRALDAVGTDDATAQLDAAHRVIDKAAAKGVIHKNQAARRKARLDRAVARAGADSAAE